MVGGGHLGDYLSASSRITSISEQAKVSELPNGFEDKLSSDLTRDLSWLPQRLRSAVRMMFEAYRYAEDLRLDVWEFAVELAALDGLTTTDVRWLVHAGLVDYAVEVTLPGESRRSFRRSTHLVHSEALCFVLSAAGAEFGNKVASMAVESEPPPQATAEATDPTAGPHDVLTGFHRATCPRWDRDRRELRVGAVLVKRFKAPAANQETILAAFQEEGWPHRIDDPLPPHPDLEPKRRVHDTVNSLNRNQKTQLVRFFGDGSGQGIRWEFIAGSERESEQ